MYLDQSLNTSLSQVASSENATIVSKFTLSAADNNTLVVSVNAHGFSMEVRNKLLVLRPPYSHEWVLKNYGVPVFHHKLYIM